VANDRSYDLMVGSLTAEPPEHVMQVSSKAVYADPGYLLFVCEGTLVAQPFDLATRRPRGEPLALADGVSHFQRTGFSDFSVSRTGVIAYQNVAPPSRVVWYTRDGSEAGVVSPPDSYVTDFRISPDGQKIVAASGEPRTGTNDLWLFDLTRGIETRVTSDAGVEWTPIWSPDGRQLVFVADEGAAPPFLHVKRVGDPGLGEPVVPSTGWPQRAWDWSATHTGTFVIYEDGTPDTGEDLMVVPLSGERRPRVFVRPPFDETDARFSPDGRWVAYVSNESGRNEVLVRAFEGAGDAQQVSTSGGTAPRWSRRSKELFYFSTDGRLVSAPFADDHIGAPRPLFSVQAQHGRYEVSDDGQRFLVNHGSGPTSVTVVVDWPAVLKR
jgi:dipeptidyl aminopeptidase/acylaminoacyl peptidase